MYHSIINSTLFSTPAYGTHLSKLALPSVLFEPRFHGTIRNILYSNCSTPLTRARLLDSNGIRSNRYDACLHQDPCRHNGLCISTDTGAICDCTNTDYTGQVCEQCWLFVWMTLLAEKMYLNIQFIAHLNPHTAINCSFKVGYCCSAILDSWQPVS